MDNQKTHVTRSWRAASPLTQEIHWVFPLPSCNIICTSWSICGIWCFKIKSYKTEHSEFFYLIEIESRKGILGDFSPFSCPIERLICVPWQSSESAFTGLELAPLSWLHYISLQMDSKANQLNREPPEASFEYGVLTLVFSLPRHKIPLIFQLLSEVSSPPLLDKQWVGWMYPSFSRKWNITVDLL